ncbi:disulfide-like protein [Cavenderia fasciculata]|uniref:Disulfide-like protein n=1 Tax=Cavenderia fasciculata TaxID=261658 RepID=F4PID6_CACFS|nr:disulfide-like protein [Cavenderia fasciculata]EGG24570.1 disulfide-like protein [Cavenderia fasciculata]|eukprot:XP_004362421.1 disulfide-like protein [Cavenderia fasciculata]
MKFIVTLVTLLVIAAAVVSSQDLPASEVVVLTEKNFDSTLASGGNWFVKFYAPWCGHCKKLAPLWEELATKTAKDVANYAKVDCTQEKSVCSQFKVRGYPTLMYFTDNGKSYYEYQGERKIESFNSFAAKPTGTKNAVSGSVESTGGAAAPIVELTKDNFDQTYNGKWMVAFYAPWCSYCKKYVPTFEKMANNYKNTVNFAKINCEVEKEICQLYQIPGYPTFKFFEGKGMKDFSMEPTEANLKFYLGAGNIGTFVHNRPWNKTFDLVQNAIIVYVWLFLGVFFTLGLFLGWVFFSPSKPRPVVAKSSEQPTTAMSSFCDVEDENKKSIETHRDELITERDGLLAAKRSYEEREEDEHQAYNRLTKVEDLFTLLVNDGIRKDDKIQAIEELSRFSLSITKHDSTFNDFIPTRHKSVLDTVSITRKDVCNVRFKFISSTGTTS